MPQLRLNYTVLDTNMVGYLSTPEPEPDRQHPGVLLMHEGGGQDDNIRERADRLARLGYVAFALDYLGDGTTHPPEFVQARLGVLRGDHAATQTIALAGYEILSAQEGVDPDRIAAVGFCFGGLMALELARSGAAVKAAVGFHPAFATPRVADSATIQASVLMFSGANDPIASDSDRSAFAGEMRDAQVADWRLEVLGGVGHSFTNPNIGARGLPGFVYDARADQRAWDGMLSLLDEVLKPTSI